jgi:1,4-dihydroxy-2-naphthoyl-CoA hydrolase
MAKAGMPFGELMGIDVVTRDKDRIVGTLTVRDELCTTNDILHGGAFMAFADTLGAIGASLNLRPGSGTTTIESKTNFLGGARVGQTITGEATPVHIGRRSSVWTTRISNADGKLLALVTQTQLVLEP